MPAGLFITAKFSLFSINIDEDNDKSFFDGEYLKVSFLTWVAVNLKFFKVTWSSICTLYELFCFFPLTFIFPLLIFFSINYCGTLKTCLLNHLSRRELEKSSLIIKSFFIKNQ